MIMYGWTNVIICFQAMLVSGVGSSIWVFCLFFIVNFYDWENYINKFSSNFCVTNNNI